VSDNGFCLILLRICINRIVSEAVSLLTKAAPGFNGRVTLYFESSLPCIFIKVTCGAARLLSLSTTMRLTYNTPLYGTHRVEESNTRRLHIRKHAQGDPTTVRDC